MSSREVPGIATCPATHELSSDVARTDTRNSPTREFDKVVGNECPLREPDGVGVIENTLAGSSGVKVDDVSVYLSLREPVGVTDYRNLVAGTSGETKMWKDIAKG